MGTDPTFQMTVEDVFLLRDQRVVVTGRIRSGTLKVGDEVNLLGRKVKIDGIEAFMRALKHAGAGDTVGVLLHDVSRDDVHPGDVLTG